jgi:hypothetical protein
MCKATRCDAYSESPGFLLAEVGTSWTVRIAMLMYREEEKKLHIAVKLRFTTHTLWLHPISGKSSLE